MLTRTNLMQYIIIIYIQINHINAKTPNPNIILIIVDDLRPALECYNDTKSITPNINKLAENSFIFTHAYSQQALCAPSRNSMLTSRRPDTLKLYDFYSYWRTDIPGNFTTLPQHLKSNGYSTYSIGKIFHPGVSSNFTDDFPYSWSEPTYHPSTEIYMNRPICPDKQSGELEKNVICPVHVRFQPFGTLPDIQSITKAKQFLANQTKSSKISPFFLAIGLHKPHIPLRFPQKYLKKHKLSKFINPEFNYIPFGLPTVAFNPYMDIRSRHDAKQQNISYPFGPMPHEFGIRMRQSYYSAVTYIDDLIGRLWTSIQWNNTIVILTSDHGWSLGEHAEWAKYSNYDLVTRVPLLIYLPPFVMSSPKPMPHKIDHPVELLDIFPTIVDLVKIKNIPKCNGNLTDNNNNRQQQCVEGKSLIKYLLFINETIKSSDDCYEYAFSQYPRPSVYPTIFSDRPTRKQIKIMGYSIKSKYFRYTAWIRFDSDKIKRDWQHVYGEELYDHRIDHHENMNLVNRSELNIVKFMLKDRLQFQFP